MESRLAAEHICSLIGVGQRLATAPPVCLCFNCLLYRSRDDVPPLFSSFLPQFSPPYSLAVCWSDRWVLRGFFQNQMSWSCCSHHYCNITHVFSMQPIRCVYFNSAFLSLLLKLVSDHSDTSSCDVSVSISLAVTVHFNQTSHFSTHRSLHNDAIEALLGRFWQKKIASSHLYTWCECGSTLLLASVLSSWFRLQHPWLHHYFAWIWL